MNRYAIQTQLSDTILVWVFVLVCAGVSVVSLVLWYHWSRYAMKDPMISFAQIVYFLGLFVLIAITLMLIL